MKNKIISLKFLILVTLTWVAMGAFGRSVKDDMPPREFSLLPGEVKTNICQEVLIGLTQKDAFLGLVQMFPEDRLYETWKNISDAEEDFFFMRTLGFRHARVIRTFGMNAGPNPHFSTNQPAYSQLRNPSNWDRLGRTKWIGQHCLYAPSVVALSAHCLFVFFERLKKHEWNPEDAFARPTVCERPVTDWPDSVRELWKTSAYGILSNCAFSVSRRHGLLAPALPAETKDMSNGARRFLSNQEFVKSLYRSARFSENWNPLIELSEREATEIVYLTALCRGRVRTMDEFNAAFVPKGETFLVRLTVPECETEIGRMLYDLARKRSLLGRKGKEGWK